MFKSLQNHKSFFLLIAIIASPFVLLGVIVFGIVVGAVGGFVWGVQKARIFLLAKYAIDEDAEGLLANVFKGIFVVYVFFFISIFAFFVCLIIGPFKAFSKLKRAWRYQLEGTAFKYKRTKSGKKSLVLVVEDEMDLADYVSGKILSTGKYATVIAYNGKEALRILEKHERFLGIASNMIGCIVLDIKMPEMDGIQFLKEIRKREGALVFKDSSAFQQIPVIMLSAYEDIDKINDATHPILGKIARYIMKPEKPEHYNELLSAIDNVFSGKDSEMVTNAYLSGNYRIHELKKTQEE